MFGFGTSRPRAGLAHHAVGAALTLALSGAGALAAPDPAQAAAPKPALSSNLDQIQNQFAQDAAAARSKFQKFSVQFTALAAGVDASPGRDLVIGFHTSQHPAPLRAVFPKAAAQAHAPVKPGDMVAVRCDDVAEVAGKLELHGCAFR